jgi:hypothetical protein
MTLQQHLLEQAIAVAGHAREHGNHPFGALLADAKGTVLLTAENTVVTGSDATGHAETNLVRLASARLSASGIGAVVYGLAETDLYAIIGDDPQNPTLVLPCRSVFAAGRRSVTVRGPFEIDGAKEVHAGFWRS